MSPAERWLRERFADAPAALLDAMAPALPSEGGGPLPEVLAAGALRIYADVLRGTGGREDALPLLAADALMTHALQAQAELDPGALADFAHRWGAAGRIGELAGSVSSHPA